MFGCSCQHIFVVCSVVCSGFELRTGVLHRLVRLIVLVCFVKCLGFRLQKPVCVQRSFVLANVGLFYWCFHVRQFLLTFFDFSLFVPGSVRCRGGFVLGRLHRSSRFC